jgi:hypothetical protein
MGSDEIPPCIRTKNTEMGAVSRRHAHGKHTAVNIVAIGQILDIEDTPSQVLNVAESPNGGRWRGLGYSGVLWTHDEILPVANGGRLRPCRSGACRTFTAPRSKRRSIARKSSTAGAGTSQSLRVRCPGEQTRCRMGAVHDLAEWHDRHWLRQREPHSSFAPRNRQTRHVLPCTKTALQETEQCRLRGRSE